METFTSFSYLQGASHLTFLLLVSPSLGLSFSGKYSGFLHRQREEGFLDYRERGWKFGGSVFSLALTPIHPHGSLDPNSSSSLFIYSPSIGHVLVCSAVSWEWDVDNGSNVHNLLSWSPQSRKEDNYTGRNVHVMKDGVRGSSVR